MQVMGWSMWFAEYLFLDRSWAKDEGKLQVCLSTLFLLTYAFDTQIIINEVFKYKYISWTFCVAVRF